MSTPQTLAAAHAEVKAEIARTDTKTGLLLAFVGAVLAGSWTVAKDVPLTVPAYVAGGLGMGVLVVAAGLLLRSVRPNLRGRHGFPLWATLTANQITATLSEDLSADIATLSRIALVKFTGLRRAVDLTCAGGALLVLAALLALGGCGMSVCLARLLNRVGDLFTSHSAPLTVGPDNGDTEEWMGERFIGEPGDLDNEGVPE